jgi:aspartyl-tRNA(Asn)/glutamyl-tRNA(Gln) amidotransferase subunit A
MTEFAYSGLGINPHYGTPLSPWDRASKRVPGGSSSGSGVAVADRMAYGALGTDTGGSCRIPAAFNGVVGYKPTARRVPTAGVVPLSTSLDSIGPLAGSVGCCQILDAVMAGEPVGEAAAFSLHGARLLVPDNLVLEALDGHVSGDFERALAALTKAGALITRGKLGAFELIAAANKLGGLSGAESFHWHRDLIAKGANQYDRRVLARILRGKEQTAADYLDLLAARQAAIQAFNAETAGFDAVVSPTVPVVAPKIADCEPDAEYNRINMLVLRNTMMLNVVDGCSIALPMHRPGAAPTSLMISGPAMTDHRVMAIAAAAEAALAA